jgi:hypothetical protein
MRNISFILVGVLLLSGCDVLSSGDGSASNEHVRATTESDTYTSGKQVAFTVQNESLVTLTFFYCGGFNYTIEKRRGTEWEKSGGYYGPCTTEELNAIEIAPGQSISRTTRREIAEPGVYRLRFEYNSRTFEGLQRAYTNEFRIEE